MQPTDNAYIQQEHRVRIITFFSAPAIFLKIVPCLPLGCLLTSDATVSMCPVVLCMYLSSYWPVVRWSVRGDTVPVSWSVRPSVCLLSCLCTSVVDRLPPDSNLDTFYHFEFLTLDVECYTLKPLESKHVGRHEIYSHLPVFRFTCMIYHMLWGDIFCVRNFGLNKICN